MNLEVITRVPSNGEPHSTPLLFVHGAWHGAWCWDEYFLPYFAERGYAAHALSLRGHGTSEGKIKGSRIKDYVADVQQVIATLPAPPVVIGHSMGGLVVQKLLETYEAPGGILVAAVPVHGVIWTTRRAFRRFPGPVIKANLTMDMHPIVATPERAKWALFAADMPDEQVAAYHARLNTESYLAYLDMMIFALPRPKRVNTPLLVLGAADDTLFAPNEIEKSARAYGAPVEIFPHMAHDMMLEAGWEQVAERIGQWLEERGI